MMLPGYGSRTGTPLTSRVVAGLKIWPPKIGRPSASVPIWLPVSSALKSPLLKASIGVVLPKPGSTPERNRVQSRLVKKNVLLRPSYTFG